MDATSKNRWQVRTAALVIFLLGFGAGALALNIYHKRQAASLASRRVRFEQVVNRLNLTPQQKSEVEKIFGDLRAQLMEIRKQAEPRYGEVRRQADERLRAVLTPEQWAQFRQMTEEMRPRRRSGGRGG
jgi:Spy/CpxP family protein refolding chaperone